MTDNETPPPTNNPISIMPIVLAVLGAAIIVVTALVIMEYRRDYNDVYPGCWTMFPDGMECEADVSARMLRGY